MRQFIYSPIHAGLDEWPSGTLRLDGIDVTDDPNAADVFVCPGNIRIFEKETGVLDMEKLNRLPYFKGNESRTAFFDCSDNFTRPLNLPILFLRCDTRDWMLPHDPNTLTFAWPVADLSECIAVPEGGFKFDVSCHAWVSSEARRIAMESCQNEKRFKSDIVGYPDFFGYIHETSEGQRRRREFLRSMKESRIALCPESIAGVFPYRFFEALSAGRVPLLVGSEMVWPFADEIPYQSFCIVCPRDRAETAGQIASEFLKSHTDEQIIEMGILARYWWKRLLDSRDWPQLHSYAVQNKLRVLQAA